MKAKLIPLMFSTFLLGAAIGAVLYDNKIATNFLGLAIGVTLIVAIAAAIILLMAHLNPPPGTKDIKGTRLGRIVWYYGVVVYAATILGCTAKGWFVWTTVACIILFLEIGNRRLMKSLIEEHGKERT